MYDNNFNIRLEALSREEAELENLLAQGESGLSDGEINAVKSRLIAVRTEKQELDQLATGAFY